MDKSLELKACLENAGQGHLQQKDTVQFGLSESIIWMQI